MPVAYPSGLPTLMHSGKRRSQDAVFGVSDPLQAYAHFQATGADVPVVWDAVFRFSSADAATFQRWFVNDLQRGVLSFTIPIRTETGLVTHTCRFLPDGLLETREVGEAWEFRARMVARKLL